MGMCQSQPCEESVSAESRTETKYDQNERKMVVRILLLGAGESGKSTIMKQIRIIHQNGLRKEERRFYKNNVYANVVCGMMQLIAGAETLEMEISEKIKKNKEILVDCVPDDLLILPDEIADAIESLWADKTIQAAFEKRSEFQLNDSAFYFFDQLDRIRDPKYIPTDDDIVMARVQTTGIQEAVYDHETAKFHVYDVPGQRSQRKKWLHCFDFVTAVLFVVAVSEYDQKLREDNKTNRMQEALMLFHTIINSKYFKEATPILFLNKKDIFEEKIKKIPIVHFFPKFEGPNTYKNGMGFFAGEFRRLCDSRKLYIHHSCATDTAQINAVLNIAASSVIRKMLESTGLE